MRESIRPLLACVFAGACLSIVAAGASAQAPGITSLGTTGGLRIPGADTLPSGTLAISAGNDDEPDLGRFSRRRNFVLGVGLAPGIELFGRLAEYQDPLPGSRFSNGVRDISANLKVQLPKLWDGMPRAALGLVDVGGGAVLFRSRYLVTTDDVGPLRWTLGYAHGTPIGGDRSRAAVLDGAFGGLELSLGATGASVLAEHDGHVARAGLRYRSPPVAMLGGAQWIATLQRSRGASWFGVDGNADRTTLSLALMLPLGPSDLTTAARLPAGARPLSPLPSSPMPVPEAARLDRLEALGRRLTAAGLERVRVGTRGSDVVVEYENSRFGQNEADALGVVFGLAAETLPAQVQRVYATRLAAGLPLQDLSVGLAEYRAFLRDGYDGLVRGSLAMDLRPGTSLDAVQWQTMAGPHSPLKLWLAPLLTHAVATDLAPYDYSLAAELRASVPLWRGAEVQASYVQDVATSQNFEPGFGFAAFRIREGLRSLALQQSFWWGRHVFASVGAGRYRHGSWGAEGEATVFRPGSDDVVRLKAGGYQRQPGQSRDQALAASASHRWVLSPATWVEAGAQQYSDGTRGPSLVLTRWFGDVAVNLFYRRGGARQFAGLELSLPLTPRFAPAPAGAVLAGTPSFTTGVRTRLTLGGVTQNFVAPDAARDFVLAYGAEDRFWNRGRTSEQSWIVQLPRMRDAFYVHARERLDD